MSVFDGSCDWIGETRAAAAAAAAMKRIPPRPGAEQRPERLRPGRIPLPAARLRGIGSVGRPFVRPINGERHLPRPGPARRKSPRHLCVRFASLLEAASIRAARPENRRSRLHFPPPPPEPDAPRLALLPPPPRARASPPAARMERIEEEIDVGGAVRGGTAYLDAVGRIDVGRAVRGGTAYLDAVGQVDVGRAVRSGTAYLDQIDVGGRVHGGTAYLDAIGRPTYLQALLAGMTTLPKPDASCDKDVSAQHVYLKHGPRRNPTPAPLLADEAPVPVIAADVVQAPVPVIAADVVQAPVLAVVAGPALAEAAEDHNPYLQQ